MSTFCPNPGTQIGKGEGRWGQIEKTNVTREAAGLGCVCPTGRQWDGKGVSSNNHHLTHINAAQELSSQGGEQEGSMGQSPESPSNLTHLTYPLPPHTVKLYRDLSMPSHQNSAVCEVDSTHSSSDYL